MIPAIHFYIIDDDPSFGNSLKRLLVAKGFSAEYFKSPQTFLDSVPTENQGYAIIDIHMPGCKGFELMETMRQMHYSMPVIVITGQPLEDSRDMAMRKGAIGFLQKPFSEDSLWEIIASVQENQDEQAGQR